MKRSQIFKILVVLAAFSFVACQGKVEDEKYEEETLQMEEVSDELEEAAQEIETEIEDLNHDVDSLLEGI